MALLRSRGRGGEGLSEKSRFSTTSNTLNLEEADAASSDADLLAKMRIALRETKEARALIFGKIIVNKKASMLKARRF